MATKSELFESSENGQPLAARMRPRSIDEFVGQDHIMGKGRLLRRAIQGDQLGSVILSGPPGCGKTTLARVIAHHTKSNFQTLNAVLTGVADIRAAIDEAKRLRDFYARRTILFVDEVHRWNRAQQDALLPWVENGTFILIGATTENPWFEVNAALVSRSRVFQMKLLEPGDLKTIAMQALGDPVRGYGQFNVTIDDDALGHLIRTCSGDARNLLNALELAVETSFPQFPPPAGSSLNIDLAIAEESIQERAVLYDRDGDYHFDSISAFIKSVRGSDPDAALYWLARMVHSGENPRFLFRRLLILASEDVGLADPDALRDVEAAAAAFERVGLPEGQFFLSQATLRLALARKSNSTMGYFDALKHIKSEGSADVPKHLKDASRDGQALGHGEGYKYPHAFEQHWVAQNYLPGGLSGKVFYHPGGLGWEGERKNEVLERRIEQLALDAIDAGLDERLTWSPDDMAHDNFARRASGAQPAWLRELAKAVFETHLEESKLRRHYRLGIYGDEALALLPRALKAVPEGQVVFACTEALMEQARRLVADLHPATGFMVVLAENDELTLPDEVVPLEALVAWGAFRTGDGASLSKQMESLCALCAPGTTIVALELGRSGSSLSRLFTGASDEELRYFAAAEDAYYAAHDASASREEALGAPVLLSFNRTRSFKESRLNEWLDGEGSDYAKSLLGSLGEEKFARYRRLAMTQVAGKDIQWPMSIELYTITVPAQNTTISKHTESLP